MKAEWKDLGDWQKLSRIKKGGVTNDFQVPVWVRAEGRSGAIHWARMFSRRGGSWQLEVIIKNPEEYHHTRRRKNYLQRRLENEKPNTKQANQLIVRYCGQWKRTYKRDNMTNKISTTWCQPDGCPWWRQFPWSESDHSGWITGINESKKSQEYTINGLPRKGRRQWIIAGRARTLTSVLVEGKVALKGSG